MHFLYLLLCIMKLRIDDVRFPPDETWDDTVTMYIKAWKYKAWVNQLLFRIILSTDKIDEISFDHDLWEDTEFNWYELMKLVIQYYKLVWYPLPKISIHSANPIWVERMERLLEETLQSK